MYLPPKKRSCQVCGVGEGCRSGTNCTPGRKLAQKWGYRPGEAQREGGKQKSPDDRSWRQEALLYSSGRRLRKK